MAESRGMNIVRSADTSILFRVVAFDSSDTKITSGTMNMRLWHVVPTTGVLETYDFNDDTFKAGAITTATATLTHQQAENSTFDTGVWTRRHTVLTDFTVGDKYVAEFSHTSLPRPVTVEFQYGDLEGDQETQIADSVWDEDIVAAHGTADTAGLLLRALGAVISQRSNNATLDALLGVPDTAGFTIAETILDEALSGHLTAGTVGETLNFVNVLTRGLLKTTAIETAQGGTGSGGDDTGTIQLQAGQSATDDIFIGDMIVTVGGTGPGQARFISAYVGSTVTATVRPDWEVVPAADTQYIIISNHGRGLVDSIWDEDIVSDHGITSSSGLILRALNVSGRTFNNTLDSLLGVPDTSGSTVAGQVWEETTAAHNTVGSMGEVMNGLIGGAAAIVDAVWDEDIVLAHGTSSSAGLLLRVLGAAISTRANNATLDALLGVTDAASTNLPDMIWDEDIVAAHSTTDTAGLLLRALGAVISQRSNNPTLDALLGVADTAAHDVPFTVWEEILSGNHVADSTGERLEALDVLTESGGAGDLADTNTQVQKIDSAATLTTPVAGSLADQIDTLVTLITGDRTIVASLNVEGTALRVEVGVEQFGVIQTTPWTQASAQIFDEDGLLIVNGTISIGDFGAINARGFFQHTILSHGLIAGKTYQMLVLITDGGSEQVTTTKIFKVIQG